MSAISASPACARSRSAVNSGGGASLAAFRAAAFQSAVAFFAAVVLLVAASPTLAFDGLRIDTYKSNYFTYNTKDVTDETQDGRLKFRLSIQSTLVDLDRASLHLSYSMTGFWEVFEDSSPFKEYVHNPEVFFRTGDGVSPWLESLQVGWEHESNGQSAGPTNRSWDRAYVERVFELGGPRLKPFEFELHPRVWWMFDDAPENVTMRDVENFGGGRAGGAIGVVLLQSETGRFFFEVGMANWALELHINTIPTTNNYSTFIQLFRGRGEGLIGFDEYTTTLGVGIALRQGSWEDRSGRAHKKAPDS